MNDAPTEAEMIAGFSATASSIVEAERTAAPPLQPDRPSLETTDERRKLRSIVDRIVRLEEEKKGLSADIKEIYLEAKSAGYTPKAVRIVVRHEMEDSEAQAARQAVEEEAELIAAALGDFASSPLGDSAVRRGRH